MLKPVEYVYLAIALAIIAQQILVRDGSFDPVASGVALAFLGLIPAGRVDKKATAGDRESLLVRLLRVLAGDDRREK